MFQTKVVQKIKTQILRSVTFSRKSCLFEIMWKTYGAMGQAKAENIIWRMRIA
jgi:hypothetical protein